MGYVISSGSMSLDGYIARDDDSVGPLFEWYESGDVEVATAMPGLSFRMTAASAAHWHAFTGRVGALVVGRTLFDYTNGWQGSHPLGVPVVVLTHEPPDVPGFHFVRDGIDAAVSRARELAGDKDVAVAAGTVAGQALAAGLLDFVAIDLVPVILGSGRRYFPSAVASLGDPVTVVPSKRVTHLLYPALGRE